ncbi:Unknown protein [Striga hermonthica]|uniref:Phosphatidate cytidylyltransferase, mitochondrial n=1 Tax=Striga hermonthica TaxID=68872 RepID=A0A9N7R7L3_STRHE|nr:Unknown protein [Striga hermonthica]
MDDEKRPGLACLLETLPAVEFGCIYGSSLHPNNSDKTSMVDYILGVADPEQWHAENLKMNRNHYASWIIQLGGARLITGVAENIGVGVHFNPFVSHQNQMFKYGVVRARDLVQDILEWERFYLSGRLQKPVNVVVDSLEIEKLNSVNLKAVTSAALLIMPSNFSEEELYAKICSLSYMGDLRMLFAEDKNKVKKIVQGQFHLFQRMYTPLLEELAARDFLRISSSADKKLNIIQDCGLSTTCSLVSHLPSTVRSKMRIKLGEGKTMDESGRAVQKVLIRSKEEAAYCVHKILRQKVMVSSARQAVAGLVTSGAVHGLKYLASRPSPKYTSWEVVTPRPSIVWFIKSDVLSTMTVSCILGSSSPRTPTSCSLRGHALGLSTPFGGTLNSQGYPVNHPLAELRGPSCTVDANTPKDHFLRIPIAEL